MAVQVQIRAVAERLSTEEWQQLPSPMQQRLQMICRGDTPGSRCEALITSGAGRLDWRRLLRRYVGEATEIQPVFTRPSRRFPALVGVVPGHLHRPAQPTVMAVIDTSSSLSTEMLAMIAAELVHLAASHTVTVVECDATVHAVYRYRGRLNAVHGRGGTDLRPPFAPAILRTVRPNVVAYFTDGCGPAPEVAPAMPVIWCLVPGGAKPAMWGRVVPLPPV
jgi:predicted metal-dependent peptidase